MRPKILLVDDEAAITDNLAPFLERSGFEVSVVGDGVAALESIHATPPDLVVLDVMMPRLDGRSVLRQLRQEQNMVSVILLTQVGESVERAMALEEGADDYLNKPFDPHELIARIRAVLRRANSGQQPLATSSILKSGPVELDRTSMRVYLTRDGADSSNQTGEQAATQASSRDELTLTPKAVALLAYFMTHTDELMSRDRLLDAVWGWDYPTGTRTVDTRIAELRSALDDDSANPRYIQTVPGQGYRYIAVVERGS